MARAKSIGIRETLTSFLPRSRLDALARESGMMRRRRKVDPMAMVWTLALGFGAGGERSLAGHRRVYQRTTGVSVVPSTFYDRFTPGLVRLLRSVVGELCERVAQYEPSHRGVLGKFADVVVADASVVKLHRMLAKRYAGTRTSSRTHAASRGRRPQCFSSAPTATCRPACRMESLTDHGWAPAGSLTLARHRCSPSPGVDPQWAGGAHITNGAGT